MESSHFLRCVGCGAEYSDDGVRLHCDVPHEPALLRTVYGQQFSPLQGENSMRRYQAWLPMRHETGVAPLSAVFQSRRLCAALNMPNLWVIFSGYWPARDALMPSATFKDLEATSVTARFPRDGRTLVVASAGNTATALAQACSDENIPLIVVMPERALATFRTLRTLRSCVRLISIAGATYDDAIVYAKELAASEPSFQFEGGVYNVARRDGLGTAMLRAVEVLGRTPDVHIQPAGTGTGAIAAYEAALRLRADSKSFGTVPRMILVQNDPAAPIFEAWRSRSRTISQQLNSMQWRARTSMMSAPVLATRLAPYDVRGGLYDVLKESRGDVVVVSNDQVDRAQRLFEELEGLDLVNAAAAALAGLLSARACGTISQHALVTLHLTGGGKRLRDVAGISPNRIERTTLRQMPLLEKQPA